ncbi:MAG: c-type cytochrome [Candidatus Contendobacter sp.]|nr:c-type cytochrome [Candidatus Contendobacter sp.]
MTSRRRSLLTLLSSLALAIPLTSLAAPPPGRLLAAQCAQCHGTNGRSVSGIDSLAGESAQELYNEMREMKNKNGDAGNIMHPVAMAYTDQQLQLIAQYFAGLKK